MSLGSLKVCPVILVMTMERVRAWIVIDKIIILPFGENNQICGNSLVDGSSFGGRNQICGNSPVNGNSLGRLPIGLGNQIYENSRR